jgi:hypothetical protein
MTEEYVVGKILEIKEKEENTSRSIVSIRVEGRIEISEHFKKYTDMFKTGDDVICVWRPEFKKITQMWFPCLWMKIARQIEPYPTKLIQYTNSKGKTHWRKVRTDLPSKKNRKKPSVVKQEIVKPLTEKTEKRLIMY